MAEVERILPLKVAHWAKPGIAHPPIRPWRTGGRRARTLQRGNRKMEHLVPRRNSFRRVKMIR
jgi:hypothetical protein